MNDSPDKHRERQLEFLRELLIENASIDGDVLEISKDMWAIHGVIPVDGEVLMAEFDTYDEAKQFSTNLSALRAQIANSYSSLRPKPMGLA
jgi:hypothetical protein